ncbi:hypothetical protein F4677DRAFT_458766 [Hypoxylon crocopeplum]|nr:hypothetical protein F4677DRAFT_458766 [Hypoxylon crocopeplum]
MAKVEEADIYALFDHYCDHSLPSLDVAHSQVLIGVVTHAHFHARGETAIDILKRPLILTSISQDPSYATAASPTLSPLSAPSPPASSQASQRPPPFCAVPYLDVRSIMHATIGQEYMDDRFTAILAMNWLALF